MIGIDFFCGAGGTTCGLTRAGIDVVGGMDNDATAQETYEQNTRANGRSCQFLHRDLTAISVQEIHDLVGPRNNDALLFTGCPPCQPFTNLNTNKDRQGDTSQLALTFLEHIRAFNPEYVMMENVPGIRQPKYGTVFEDFTTGLRDLGYDIDFGVLNAKDFGVPQSRRRMIIVASTLGPISLPQPTHGPNRPSPYVTSGTAFRFPPLEAGARHDHIPNHQASGLSDLNLRRIRAVPHGGGGRRDWPPELDLACYEDHDGHTDVYGRMDPTKPAPTLTTRFNSLSNGRFGHPTEDRAISLREGAALQTFPDDYVFQAAHARTIARHIGNAVPVLLAQVIGLLFLAHHAILAAG